MFVPRRKFLRALGAVGLAVLGFLYPGLGDAPARSRPGAAVSEAATGSGRLSGFDPGFATGRVVARTADGVILESAAGRRTLRFPPGAVVWKEFHVGPEAVEVGDWVYARGEPLPDGSLLARSGWVWVNIGRRDGVVVDVGAGGLTIRHAKGTEVIEVSPGAEVIDLATGGPLAGGLSGLSPGMVVGMVGVVLAGGRFRATRLWTRSGQG